MILSAPMRPAYVDADLEHLRTQSDPAPYLHAYNNSTSSALFHHLQGLRLIADSLTMRSAIHLTDLEFQVANAVYDLLMLAIGAMSEIPPEGIIMIPTTAGSDEHKGGSVSRPMTDTERRHGQTARAICFLRDVHRHMLTLEEGAFED